MKTGSAALLSLALAGVIVLVATVSRSKAPDQDKENQSSRQEAKNEEGQRLALQDKAKGLRPSPQKRPRSSSEEAQENSKKPEQNKAPEQEQGPEAPSPKTFQTLKEASPEDLDELERLVLEQDASGLLAFFKENKSIARFEALRRFMELRGQESIPSLIELLSSEKDPALHGLLGDALGAGAQASDIPAMSMALQKKLSPSARLALANAFIELSDRLHPASQRSCKNIALKELRTLVLNQEWGEAAIAQLPSCGPEGLDELEKLCGAKSLSESKRVLAATFLAPVRKESALRTLRDIAKTGQDPKLRAIAAQSLERLK